MAVNVFITNNTSNFEPQDSDISGASKLAISFFPVIMRITCVGLGWEQLSLSLLSAIAKKNCHQVNLVFDPALFNDRLNLDIPLLGKLLSGKHRTLAEIHHSRPDVLICSPLTSTYQYMLEIARDVKSLFPEITTIFGGTHVSALPDRVLKQEEVDYICIGEGDLAFPMILDNIAKGTSTVIPNVRYTAKDGTTISGKQAGFLQNLDLLPMFDKVLWEEYVNYGDIYFTMASRGCPNHCTYCFNNYFKKIPGSGAGKYVRYRSVDHMMAELNFAKRRYTLKNIQFEDDVFTFNKNWLNEFLLRYKKEINLPFQCLSHPLYMNDETARLLADSGCRYVQMGIQSMDDQYKKEILERFESSEHVERALTAMHKYGIKTKLDHMFGLPGEPITAQEKARDIFMRHRPYRVQTFWTNYLPGTALTEKVVKEGLLRRDELEMIYEGRQTDSFHGSCQLISPEMEKTYRAYETMFKLMLILPKKFTDHRAIGFFKKIPGPICSLMTMLVDIFYGLLKRDPEHVSYAKHYIHHSFAILARATKRGTPKASKIREDVTVKYCHKDDTAP